ncbi:MAG TPA: phosphoadenylyl-sulfate reductase [Chthonomonadaceae bacterium]|nr:phosphoadenylyl-sulfate reductase [Chthonomonadaceae bacterium]
MGATLSADALRQASERMENWSPEEILRWAVETYGSGLAFATAFGVEGCVLLAMLAGISGGRDVRVFNLETGYQFPETLALRETIRERYGIEVEYVRARESAAEMEARFGGPIYGRDPDACCRIRKVEPLRDALRGHAAWMSAIRRDQTPDRARVAITEWDAKFELVKVSPLANWTKGDVWAYAQINEVPVNPLHERGYSSIGCWPCTRAVAAGEGDRAGRWADFAKLECGLHSRGS